MDEVEEQRLAIIRPFLLPVDEHGNPRSAIEAARQFGVDIEYLRYLRTLTPTERLHNLEEKMRVINKFRAAMKTHRDEAVLELWCSKLDRGVVE